MEKSLDYEVGQKVKSWRLERGYTQKDLAEKVGVKYWAILQYEKGSRKIPIKKLYAIAEALSVNVKGLVCGEMLPNEKRYFEDEEILNLVKGYKDKELSEVFYLLIKFIRLSEERSRKAVKMEVARGLMKVGVSAHVISRTTNLSIGECEENKIPIPYKVGQRIKEWRLIRGYTQKDLANKVGITNQGIYEYEQGRAAVSLEMLDEIAKVLSISIIDLLPESDEDSEVEEKLSNLIEEYKKIESRELRNVLIKSLFEGIHVCKEKVREEKKIEVARNLVKEGIAVDIILQTTGLSNYMMGTFKKVCQAAFLVQLNFQSIWKENIKLRHS